MARTFRSNREGEVELRRTVTRASSTVATIPNYGTSLLTTGPGTDYVLAPPAEGVIKTLLMNQATTGVLVRACPAGTTGITFNATGGDAVIEFDATGNKSVGLVGLNSTAWAVLYRHPATTAINVGTS